MTNCNETPTTVLDAFPMLFSASHIHSFNLPDTIFNIFNVQGDNLLALVTTDYPDPYSQSRELKKLSDTYEFIDLIAPHGNDSIKILKHDDMDGDFFVTAPYKNYRLYYYLANLKSTK